MTNLIAFTICCKSVLYMGDGKRTLEPFLGASQQWRILMHRAKDGVMPETWKVLSSYSYRTAALF
jgi:hypothetical protein